MDLLKKVLIKNNNKGFSLLEVIIASGLLTIIIGQVMSFFSTSMSIAQSNLSELKAIEAYKQAVSQARYILQKSDDEYATNFKKSFNYAWSADNNYLINFEIVDKKLDMAKMFNTLKTIKGQLDPKEKAGGGDPMADMGANMMLGAISKDISKTVKLKVTWKQGAEDFKLEGTFVLFDKKTISDDIKKSLAKAISSAGMPNK